VFTLPASFFVKRSLFIDIDANNNDNKGNKSCGSCNEDGSLWQWAKHISTTFCCQLMKLADKMAKYYFCFICLSKLQRTSISLFVLLVLFKQSMPGEWHGHRSALEETLLFCLPWSGYLGISNHINWWCFQSPQSCCFHETPGAKFFQCSTYNQRIIPTSKYNNSNHKSTSTAAAWSVLHHYSSSATLLQCFIEVQLASDHGGLFSYWPIFSQDFGMAAIVLGFSRVDCLLGFKCSTMYNCFSDLEMAAK